MRRVGALHGARDRPGQRGLAGAREVLEQQVPLGEHAGQGQPDDVLLAEHRLVARWRPACRERLGEPGGLVGGDGHASVPFVGFAGYVGLPGRRLAAGGLVWGRAGRAPGARSPRGAPRGGGEPLPNDPTVTGPVPLANRHRPTHEYPFTGRVACAAGSRSTKPPARALWQSTVNVRFGGKFRMLEVDLGAARRVRCTTRRRRGRPGWDPCGRCRPPAAGWGSTGCPGRPRPTTRRRSCARTSSW